MCDSCDSFKTEIALQGPDQLRRVVARLQEAVRTGILECETDTSDSAELDQVSFAALDLGGTVPDILVYDFRCPRCGGAFNLEAETYHGQGGRWTER